MILAKLKEQYRADYKDPEKRGPIDALLGELGLKVVQYLRYSEILILSITDPALDQKTAIDRLDRSGLTDYAEPDQTVGIN